MAVEETEYYSLHQGNGVSGGVRESRASAPKRKKVSASSSTGMTSFLQGITLGTVLLIPVGVWCWVRVDEISPARVEAVETKLPKSNRNKMGPVGPKKKPAKVPSSIAAPRVTEVEAVKVQSFAEAEPPPPLAPPIPAVPAVATAIPKVTDEVEAMPKPKKSVWRAISSPFRGKSKAPQAEPDGQP